MKEGPKTVEAITKDDNSKLWVMKQWLKPMVIDVPTSIRGPPKCLPPVDTFLAYLEWKLK